MKQIDHTFLPGHIQARAHKFAAQCLNSRKELSQFWKKYGLVWVGSSIVFIALSLLLLLSSSPAIAAQTPLGTIIALAAFFSFVLSLLANGFGFSLLYHALPTAKRYREYRNLSKANRQKNAFWFDELCYAMYRLTNETNALIDNLNDHLDLMKVRGMKPGDSEQRMYETLEDLRKFTLQEISESEIILRREQRIDPSLSRAVDSLQKSREYTGTEIVDPDLFDAEQEVELASWHETDSPTPGADDEALSKARAAIRKERQTA